MGLGARISETEEIFKKLWIYLHWHSLAEKPTAEEKQLLDAIKKHFTEPPRDPQRLTLMLKLTEEIKVKYGVDIVSHMVEYGYERDENNAAHRLITKKGGYMVYPDPGGVNLR
jgi:hypothetical protein